MHVWQLEKKGLTYLLCPARAVHIEVDGPPAAGNATQSPIVSFLNSFLVGCLTVCSICSIALRCVRGHRSAPRTNLAQSVRPKSEHSRRACFAETLSHIMINDYLLISLILACPAWGEMPGASRGRGPQRHLSTRNLLTSAQASRNIRWSRRGDCIQQLPGCQTARSPRLVYELSKICIQLRLRS